GTGQPHPPKCRRSIRQWHAGLILAGCDSSIEFAGTQSTRIKRTKLVTPSPARWAGWRVQYFASTRFTKIDPKAQSTKRAIIEDCLREPPEPESTLTLASCPLKEITPAIVMMLMDRKVKDGKRGAANNRKNTYQRFQLGDQKSPHERQSMSRCRKRAR